ncbi:MAG: molybdopterin molybdenumtransferase MoeA, partial [Alphaproteobacteria bacterium]|nr:molybdopterin molybdenumtransferase MoeA [Alphaproteobacteria bacterium]
MQLSEDCFAFGGPLLTAAEALDVLRARIAVVAGTGRVPLAAALGRILAADVAAARDVP